MEFSNMPPRPEPAALSTPIAQRQAPDAISTAPETSRPVLAAEMTGASARTTGESFQPLDVYEVGDNDYVPVPPEPPRPSTVLAVLADAPGVEGVEAPPSPADLIADTLREIEEGPANPTVDIRR